LPGRVHCAELNADELNPPELNSPEFPADPAADELTVLARDQRIKSNTAAKRSRAARSAAPAAAVNHGPEYLVIGVTD